MKRIVKVLDTLRLDSGIFKKETFKGKEITQPGMAVSISNIIGTSPLEKLIDSKRGYYSQLLPDFDKMSIDEQHEFIKKNKKVLQDYAVIKRAQEKDKELESEDYTKRYNELLERLDTLEKGNKA